MDTVLGFQSFVSNTNHLKTNLLDPEMGPYQVQSLRLKVNLGVMGIKAYSALFKTAELKPNYQVQFSVIPRTLSSVKVTGVIDFF